VNYVLQKIEAFVIKTQDYGESNKIITLFSQSLGKFSAIARGAKKTKSRMAAVTQPFIYGRFFVYVNKGLSTIQQGEIIDSYRPIREDIIKTSYAAYISELTDKLMDSQSPDLYIFDQFLSTIRWIAEHDSDEVEIPIMMYELKMFAKGGFAPVVDCCVRCGNKEQLQSFSIADGGLLCVNCQQGTMNTIALPESLRKLLYVFAHIGIERLGTVSVKPDNKRLLRLLLDAYYDQYGSYYLKSRRVLKQLDQLM